LSKIKEKKKRKDNIKKELEKVEKGNKRKISSFFDSKLISMINRRSGSGSAYHSSDPLTH
jgi:hypothetical protein